MTELSILIVNYNSWGLCVEALRSLDRNRPRDADGAVPFEVIVVDNCSPQRDEVAEVELRRLLEGMDGQLIQHDQNGGYSTGMNLAFARSRGRYVLCSNPDVIFPPGCIDLLLAHLRENPTTGVAVPSGFLDRERIVHLPPNILPTMADLLITTAGEFIPWVSRRYSLSKAGDARRVWAAADAGEDVELDMISGCCFLMAREFIDQIGLLDERYPLYFEDADLCVRVGRARRRIVQVAGASLIHLYNQSGQTDSELAMSRHWISRRRYYRKWYGVPGGWVYDLCHWLPKSRIGRRLVRVAPHGPTIDLGASSDKPVIRLPRSCQRFMLQLSMDPRFYLSAALFGSGESWTPCDATFPCFSDTVYFARAFDVSGDRAEELMTYRFEVNRALRPSGSAGHRETVHDRA